MDDSIDIMLLDRQKRVVFCLASCERLFPSYTRFCSEFSFGNPQFMRALLDDLWKAAKTGNPSATRTDLEEAIIALDELAPDTEQYSSSLAAAALSFVAAVAGILKYVVDDDIDSLLSVPTQVTDAIDLWVMDTFGAGATTDADELSVQRHPLFQREQKRQLDDFYRLSTTTSELSEVIEGIRKNSSYDVLVLE